MIYRQLTSYINQSSQGTDHEIEIRQSTQNYDADVENNIDPTQVVAAKNSQGLYEEIDSISSPFVVEVDYAELVSQTLRQIEDQNTLKPTVKKACAFPNDFFKDPNAEDIENFNKWFDRGYIPKNKLVYLIALFIFVSHYNLLTHHLPLFDCVDIKSSKMMSK